LGDLLAVRLRKCAVEVPEVAEREELDAQPGRWCLRCAVGRDVVGQGVGEVKDVVELGAFTEAVVSAVVLQRAHVRRQAVVADVPKVARSAIPVGDVEPPLNQSVEQLVLVQRGLLVGL